MKPTMTEQLESNQIMNLRELLRDKGNFCPCQYIVDLGDMKLDD